MYAVSVCGDGDQRERVVDDRNAVARKKESETGVL
jgi:hypothetical protein